METISYDHRIYESVDDMSLSKIKSRKSTENKIRSVIGLSTTKLSYQKSCVQSIVLNKNFSFVSIILDCND